MGLHESSRTLRNPPAFKCGSITGLCGATKSDTQEQRMGNVTTELAQNDKGDHSVLGRQTAFTSSTEPESFSKSKWNKDVDEKFSSWDKWMGRKKMKSR